MWHLCGVILMKIDQLAPWYIKPCSHNNYGRRAVGLRPLFFRNPAAAAQLLMAASFFAYPKVTPTFKSEVEIFSDITRFLAEGNYLVVI